MKNKMNRKAYQVITLSMYSSVCYWLIEGVISTGWRTIGTLFTQRAAADTCVKCSGVRKRVTKIRSGLLLLLLLLLFLKLNRFSLSNINVVNILLYIFNLNTYV